MEIYVVRAGDTVYSIADMFGVTAERIIQNNGLLNPEKLVVGQTLVIQIPRTVHIVKAGDTLYSIARMYGKTVIQLLQNNPYLILNRELQIGEEVVIDYEGEKIGNVRVNGYAYPFINTSVLQMVLPYLTTVTVFGYGFDTEGELYPPRVNDDEVIRLAYDYSAAPIMLISSMDANGVFNSYIASEVFRNEAAQDNLIDNILSTMKQKGYVGLDVDFEFIEPDDRLVYQEFLRNVTARLNAEGYTVNVDLAPKVSADQPGLLYEAHDYEAIGGIADTVLLMTYEWGYMYSEPKAVAPIPEVRRVLDFGVSVIEPKKIYMGVPNYGYDWNLPYVKGTAATVIGNDEAVRIAAQNNASIQFDERAQSPYFNYTDQFGRQHEVWFEDARSIDAKLRLIDEYGLLGAGYWNIMRPFDQNWLVLNGIYNIEKIV